MTKTPINTLILDYGGVISLPQSLEHVARLTSILSQGADGFSQVYRRLRPDYDRGRLSGSAYWAAVLAQFDLEPDEAVIQQLIQADVTSWSQLNHSMLQFIRTSRAQVANLAIISNMTRETLVYMRQHFDWLDVFDVLTFSCDLDMIKPESGIYCACLDELGVPAEQCLFVDDSLTNVRGAQDAGLNAVQFTTFDAFEAEVQDTYRFEVAAD